jgi:hypothetical protein
MIKVATFIQTTGSEKFREFLAQPFLFSQLCPIDAKVQSYFEGWKGKDMGNWIRFRDEEKHELEIYPDTYKTTGKQTLTLPHPKTLNDFINDMDRNGVQLYWNLWMDENFEPKDYLPKDEIETYFTHLLIKMQKEKDLD